MMALGNTAVEEPAKQDQAMLVGVTADASSTWCTNSTDESEDSSGSESPSRRSHRRSSVSLFKSAQWTQDGTSIIASRENNSVETYILPPDLLSGQTHILKPYSTHQFPSPVHAVAVYPYFELNEPSSCLYLVSPANLPTRLQSPFRNDSAASYPLVNPTTEAFIAPHSLYMGTLPTCSEYFYAGSDCQVSVFNLHRDGDGPFQEMKTIPSRRKKLVGGGVGFKGIVSALDMSPEGILAAGSFSRWVGLYDGEGRGGTVGVFELGRDATDSDQVGEGAGITQVIWSSCGRYLCTVERQSDGIAIWDIRGSGTRLAWLSGRNAHTMQRLSVNTLGKDIWAGGIDGYARVWRGIGDVEGTVEPSWEFKGHDDVVSSAAIHSSGGVLATCSGQRHSDEQSSLSVERSNASSSSIESEESSSSSSRPGGHEGIDNSLKLWSLDSTAKQNIGGVVDL